MMYLDGEEYGQSHSDMGSEDEYQEAVTPSPEPSPEPEPLAAAALAVSNPAAAGVRHMPSLDYGDGMVGLDRHSEFSQLDKATAARFSGIKVEDALLLLSFHQHMLHIVHSN